MLTEIAILVDKYELLATAEIMIYQRFQDLESDIPTSFIDDLFLWTCLSWVFKKLEIF